MQIVSIIKLVGIFSGRTKSSAIITLKSYTRMLNSHVNYTVIWSNYVYLRMMWPSRPPDLDVNISSAAALSVAQLWGSDFVDPTVLWVPIHQQLRPPEIALFVEQNDSRRLHIDEYDNLSLRSPDSRLAPWLPYLPINAPILPPLGKTFV